MESERPEPERQMKKGLFHNLVQDWARRKESESLAFEQKEGQENDIEMEKIRKKGEAWTGQQEKPRSSIAQFLVMKLFERKEEKERRADEQEECQLQEISERDEMAEMADEQKESQVQEISERDEMAETNEENEREMEPQEKPRSSIIQFLVKKWAERKEERERRADEHEECQLQEISERDEMAEMELGSGEKQDKERKKCEIKERKREEKIKRKMDRKERKEMKKREKKEKKELEKQAKEQRKLQKKELKRVKEEQKRQKKAEKKNKKSEKMEMKESADKAEEKKEGIASQERDGEEEVGESSKAINRSYQKEWSITPGAADIPIQEEHNKTENEGCVRRLLCLQRGVDNEKAKEQERESEEKKSQEKEVKSNSKVGKNKSLWTMVRNVFRLNTRIHPEVEDEFHITTIE